MNDEALADVNVDDGFLIKFDCAFREYYGQDSQFVLTLSDYFTLALARMLEANNMLKTWDSVARFSSDNAVDIISNYFEKVDGVKQNALQESFGKAPIGSTQKMLDHNLGQGTFFKMCEELKE